MWFIVGHPQGSIIENRFGESAGSMLLMLSGRHGVWGEEPCFVRKALEGFLYIMMTRGSLLFFLLINVPYTIEDIPAGCE